MLHLRESLRGEHGAVATVFAIVFGAGVFVFLLALTVDVGRIYAERRVAQNAADAAAMAVRNAAYLRAGMQGSKQQQARQS